MTEEEWLNICQINSSTTSSGQWREFAWKNIIRFFTTPKKTFLQNGRIESGYCWRHCNNVMADHCHNFCCCPMIQPYWLGVFKEIKSIIGFETEYNLKTLYLCNLPDELDPQAKYLLKILLLASKKSITRKWLKREAPTVREWSATVQEIYEMETLTFSLRPYGDKTLNYWLKWLLYVSR